ncbi:MAG TPA: pitrilysin family protein [Gemmatimonadota bacterium]|nr:pitrilysin family protein [Gemmatimonadota bacterium]
MLSATLENGLEILVVERSELPKVAVTLVTRAGSAADLPGKGGTAHLTVTTMDLGTMNRNALEIENALGDLGTSVDGEVFQERSLLSFDVLERNLAPAFAIFADVVRNPVFPEGEFEREKKRLLDMLAQEGTDPNALAWDRIGNMLIFGRDHPYGRPRRGLPSSVEGITRVDLAAFHRTYWRPGGSALIFVGDVTLSEAVKLAREQLGVWDGLSPEVPIPEPAPMDPRKVYVVDRQDAAQTVIAQILPGPPRRTEDHYLLQVADAVWGGGFGTRLNLNLREDKGYSYGVFSFPTHFSKFGMWMAVGGVQTDRTRESVVEFVAELKNLAGERPISEEELAHAKANRVRGYAQNFEALRDVATQVAELWTAGLPMTEFQRAVEELGSAELALVNATAQKYALPEQARLLLVGDLSKMGGVLELGLGELVVLDVEGRPVARN